MWPSELKINILLGLWEPCVAVLGLGKSRQHTASIVRFLGPIWMCHFSYFSVVIVWESGIWDFYNFGGFLGFCIFSIFCCRSGIVRFFGGWKKILWGWKFFLIQGLSCCLFWLWTADFRAIEAIPQPVPWIWDGSGQRLIEEAGPVIAAVALPGYRSINTGGGEGTLGWGGGTSLYVRQTYVRTSSSLMSFAGET